MIILDLLRQNGRSNIDIEVLQRKYLGMWALVSGLTSFFLVIMRCLLATTKIRSRVLAPTPLKTIALILTTGLVVISSACARDDIKPTSASKPPELTILSSAKPFESEPSLEFSYREARISDNNIVVRTAGGAVVIGPSGELQRSISNDNYSEVNAFVLSGKQLFLGYDQAAVIYDINTGKQTGLFATTNPKQFTSAAGISKDFSVIYALNGIYRDKNEKVSATLPRLPNVIAAEFSADNSMLLTASAIQGFGTAIWDTQTGKKIHQLNDASTAFAFFSANGNNAFVVKNANAKGNIMLSKDKVILVYDGKTGKELSQMKHDDSIVSISPVTKNRRLYTGTKSGSLVSWSLDTYKKLQQWSLESEVWAMSLDDHNYLWCGLENGKVVAINLDTNQLSAISTLDEVVRSIDVRGGKAALITGHGSRLLITAKVKYF